MVVGTPCNVIVVRETNKLMKLANAAVRRMGERLNSAREVKADARRFAERIARNPKSLDVQVLHLVGFCDPVKDQPHILEPLVIHEERAQSVTSIYAGIAEEHQVVLTSTLDDSRDVFIAEAGRRLAHDLFLTEAMSEAVFAADPDMTLESMSFDPSTLSVDLDPDDYGKITDAAGYTLNREAALRVFLEFPNVPIDTNHLEREIRPIALGRKNWLFCWTEVGAESVGIVQSLLATCRLQNVDPYVYLVDVLRRVDSHPFAEVSNLTPRLWKQQFAGDPLRSVIDRRVQNAVA